MLVLDDEAEAAAADDDKDRCDAKHLNNYDLFAVRVYYYSQLGRNAIRC